ncbi:MAG: NTF2 fold immunity protein [Moraxellaceae bacterium]|nr:NTF2 fold immunity protein [Moraxellaceae bacterium]MDZ4387649.1 NTF2 fold immunity protein [Moraxellaceae bacterium]
MSKLLLLIILTMAGTANANSKCPETPANQVVITSASHAIEAAKKAMLKIHKADYLAGFEPFTAEKNNNIWHVYGSLPPDTFGGTPEGEVCATTGEVLDIYHSQ